MSVETFSPQFTDVIKLPDDVEVNLRRILLEYARINGNDLETALHNPGDALGRICNVLSTIHKKPTQRSGYRNLSGEISSNEYLRFCKNNNTEYTIDEQYFGTNFDNALALRTTRKLSPISGGGTIYSYDLACSLDAVNHDYSGGAIIIVTIIDDTDKLQLVCYDGINEDETIKRIIIEPNDPVVAGIIYSHLINLANNYINELPKTSRLSEYTRYELGLCANIATTNLGGI